MKPKAALALLVNPNAGRKHGRQIAADTAVQLKNTGISVEVFVSLKPGGTLSIAKSLNQDEWSGVIVVGGDGSLFEVLNGLHSSGSGISIPVGQIPVGTGNSYIRDLGIFTVENAVKSIITREFRSVDIGFCTCDTGDYRFINILGAGFVANVAKRAIKYKFLGSKSYIFGVIEEVLCLDPVPIRLHVDNKVIERDVLFVEICNSRFTGGNMMMAPAAEIDDGLLDIIVMNSASRLRALKLLPKIFTGAHVDAPEVEVFQGRWIKLESERPMPLNIDGETFGYTPFEVGIDTKAIKMFALPSN